MLIDSGKSIPPSTAGQGKNQGAVHFQSLTSVMQAILTSDQSVVSYSTPNSRTVEIGQYVMSPYTCVLCLGRFTNSIQDCFQC